MEFSIRDYDKYNESEILDLYQSVGWTNYTDSPDMLKNAYAHSLKVLAAYANDTLLVIIRVVGDGYSIVYIQDIIVRQKYQHQGIGTALLQEILKTYEAVYQKSLLTENTEKTIRFYKSAGFEMDTDIDCRAFIKMY